MKPGKHERPLKIVIVIGWLKAQRETNTSLCLFAEAWNRGHEVWLLDYLRFGAAPSGAVIGHCVRPRHEGARISREEVVQALRADDLVEERQVLSDFDLAFLRNNPFERNSSWSERVANPSVMFGRELERAGVLVVNRPDALVKHASVLNLGALFSDSDPGSESDLSDMIPKTLISREEEELRAFIDGLDAPAVLKPLHGYGGAGVFRIVDPKDPNLGSIIDTLRSMGFVVAQEFIEGAAAGDVRALLWNGRPLPLVGGFHSAYRRVHPAQDFRNNMHVGGRREAHRLSERELTLLRRIGPALREDGILFAGVDLVGEKLLEVNVYAPGGIHNINELYDTNIAGMIFDELDAPEALEALRGGPDVVGLG
jgi:glutathione synthase